MKFTLSGKMQVCESNLKYKWSWKAAIKLPGFEVPFAPTYTSSPNTLSSCLRERKKRVVGS